MTGPTVALAGAAGDLGSRIARALVARGADVRALVRPDSSPSDLTTLRALGATPAAADPADVNAVAAAVEGADVVVSALNGLRDVILDRQSILLDAAVRANVPRFVPSDFSADFTRTEPGLNRNFDLRREFAGRVDRAPVQVTSILNGAFMDLVGGDMPIVQPRLRRVLHWGDAEQPLDFTTKDDVAAFTAAAALDPTTPRWLRIAGDTVTASSIARDLTAVTGERYRTLRAGGTGVLTAMIGLTKTLAPQPDEVFSPWQGMQYMRDMFSGQAKLEPLDNDRYPDVRWTRLPDHLAGLPLATAVGAVTTAGRGR